MTFNTLQLSLSLYNMDTKDANLLELLRSVPICSYAQCLTFVQAIAVGEAPVPMPQWLCPSGQGY